MAVKSNRTPFSDLALLLPNAGTRDAEGYITQPATPPDPREVWCNFTEGVSRNEFYEALKAGMKLTATVEIWEDDYGKEEYVSISDTLYRVGRVWPSGTGTLFLYLEEVVK